MTSNTPQRITVVAVLSAEIPQRVCDLCWGSGWIPGIAWSVGPLDEMPCPQCSASSQERKG